VNASETDRRQLESIRHGLGRRRGWVSAAREARTAVVPVCLAAAIFIGIVSRLAQYFADRSLWFDESLVSLNILNRSAGGLLGNLSFDQAAPAGFLLIEKAATTAFGTSEYALRLFPLICGLVSVPLLAAIARSFLRAWASVLATLLFACAASPIYYASEVKQYSGDLAAGLVLVLLAPALLRADLTRTRAASIAFAGTLAILVSHASVFVVGSIALVIALRWIVRRERPKRRVLAVLGIWLGATMLIVATSLRAAAHLESLSGSGSSIYAKAPSSAYSLSWLRVPLSSFDRLMGFSNGGWLGHTYWAFVALAIIGAASLAFRRPLQAGFLIGPFPLTLVASAVHKYPIFDRTVLFLVPAVVIFVAEGTAVVAGAMPRISLRRTTALALTVAVLLLPLVRAAGHLIKPREHEEIKVALHHIRDHWRPGDTLYVSGPTQFAMGYYLECECFAPADVTADGLAWRFSRVPMSDSVRAVLRSVPPHFVVGRPATGGYAGYTRDIDALRGQARVWLLYTHATNPSETWFLRHQVRRRLDRLGQRLDSFSATGAILYLYDLRPSGG
jgi:hypothetical protein